MGLSNPKLSASLFDLEGLWWVSGGDIGKSMVGFFGGVGHFGVGFLCGMVQGVGVLAIVGSNWFGGLCVCGSVNGLCLCVCGSVNGLMVCVCVCVVMGLDRLIGVSWVCVCGSMC